MGGLLGKRDPKVETTKTLPDGQVLNEKTYGKHTNAIYQSVDPKGVHMITNSNTPLKETTMTNIKTNNKVVDTTLNEQATKIELKKNQHLDQTSFESANYQARNVTLTHPQDNLAFKMLSHTTSSAEV